MILSHKLKCIFVKTRKTGGTSFEIALSKFCGPDDIVTPISKVDEKIREKNNFVTRQHYRKPLKEYNKSELFRLILKGIKAKNFYNHIPAKEIKAKIDDKIWDEYLKFTIERNPWDKTVSRFFWKHRDLLKEGADEKELFDKFIFSGKFKEGSDFEKYSLDGKPAMDFYIRYEKLDEDLKKLSEKLGLSENLHDLMKNIKAKGAHRPKGRDYHDYYNDETKKIVEDAFKKEIEIFGFEY